MGDIFDNSSLKPTTPVSGQEAQGATQTTGQAETPGTQTTEQNPSAAIQTTDANQASGGQDNAGISQQSAKPTPGDGTTQPSDSSIPSTGTVVGNGTTVPAGDVTTQPADGSTTQPFVMPHNTLTDGAINESQLNRLEGAFNDGVKPSYLADWGNTDFMTAVKDGNRPIAEYMRDYNKWAAATGHEPLDVFTMMQAINGNDINESYANNEKAARKLKRQQTWEQIGNVLAHLGNFVGTIAGAPSATYETAEHLTARQQAVRDSIQKQQGDPKNILAMIWKDRADQRARELNNANIALQGARKANVEGQTANQKAQSDANVALRGAQQRQAETAADENQAQTGYINGKNKREQDLQPFKKKNIQSSTNANNARANASNASANSSNANAQKTRLEKSIKSRQEQEDADFEALYNDPEGKKYIDAYAKNNGLDVGNNNGTGTGGGTWSNKNNRRAAVRWAKYKMSHKTLGTNIGRGRKSLGIGLGRKK